MNLQDREILELNELCGAVIDGTLSDAQRARLGEWLRESEAARRFYVRALGQSASLQTYAAEMHAEAPDRAVQPGRVIHASWWTFVALATAAALLLAFALTRNGWPAGAAPRTDENVARITALKDAQWRAGAQALEPGAHLRKGQRIELGAGFLEVTFDSGARVVLEGAAAMDINSAWDATLRDGTLKASVPPEAIGFRVASSAVEVVDLGTEFTMIADGKGAADVLVLKGEVEAAPRSPVDQETILLREKESRRFGQAGVSDVADSDRKFALFTQPLALDRFSPPVNYVHWSFDEPEGNVAAADVGGIAPAQAAAAQLNLGDVADGAASRSAGHRKSALHFDGRLYAKASLPGISGSSPRTVSFWVKVPEEANTDAWMVSWTTAVKKLSSRPVQISWNRRPGDGSFGALRTDFGGGYAIGAHDLRDGRWHHVAVYFSAGDDANAPVQVKQYIDGRLESSTITLTPGKSALTPVTGDGALVDMVWLGCRLTGKQPERFRGDIDELFIADRCLEPNEIVQLMRDNRMPAAALAGGAAAKAPSGE